MGYSITDAQKDMDIILERFLTTNNEYRRIKMDCSFESEDEDYLDAEIFQKDANLLKIFRDKLLGNYRDTIIPNRFPKEVEARKRKDHFPQPWMLTDPIIGKKFAPERNHSKFLNYTYDFNRFGDTKTLEGYKINGKPVAYIAINKDFYKLITESIGCSKIWVQKEIAWLVDGDQFKVVNVDKYGIRTIADGYYTKGKNNGWYKHPYITKENSLGFFRASFSK